MPKTETEMAEELTYEDAFPGRFLQAAHLRGKQVTVTIARAYMEVLEGEKGKENRLIFAFERGTKEMVVNKTNAFCMKEMFSNKVASWVGRRITMYPTETPLGKKIVPCIRLYGSPDLSASMDISARIGRKAFKATLHKVATAAPKAIASAPPTENADAEPFEYQYEPTTAGGTDEQR